MQKENKRNRDKLYRFFLLQFSCFTGFNLELVKQKFENLKTKIKGSQNCLIYFISNSNVSISFSVSLDPEEDKLDPTIFYGLHTFLKNDLNQTELNHFISSTIKNIVNRALSLKLYKPPKGLNFSLQQQSKNSCPQCSFFFAYL